jgi:peptidoglycan/xylan/chitin deacetylase (PgdA/CDA1 family)
MRDARQLRKDYKIILWSWLSYDYDQEVNIDEILDSAEKSIKGGDVLVLHDNVKASERLKDLLPRLIQLIQKKKLRFEVISA